MSYSITIIVTRVTNPPGMGGRLPELNAISRLPPDVAREMIISRNAPNLVLLNDSISKYMKCSAIGIVNKMGYRYVAFT